jgi:CubicO group peptidase (beta-lactamase class C family)
MTTAGLSEPGLARLHEVMARHVERRNLPGAVWLVARGDEVHIDVVGSLAVDGSEPMRPDTIFRLASVTKPIAALAAMILVEECRLRLDDPIDELLPELADRQVLKRLDGALEDTEPAKRPITMRDLLTFRMGLGAIMAPPDSYPVQQAMETAGVAPGPELPRHAPDEYLRRLGELPLLHHPGERWLYNTGSDVLGILIARATGQSLGAFLRDRIFDPLGMTDTGFDVRQEDVHRLATFYRADPSTGALTVFDEARDGGWSRPPVFESAAGGLASTVHDLLRFSQLMLSGGRYAGERLVSRRSIALMTTDHVTPAQKAASPFFPGFWDNLGWGFGLSITTKRIDLWDSPGRYGWAGGYGTYWYADPAEDLTGVLLTQLLVDAPSAPHIHQDFWTSVYGALDD